MAKTPETLQLERNIYVTTRGTGVFGCFEVTIGWYGDERVDFLTYNTKGIWRCYEIKASKSDFYSNVALTFVGHYNYFVMPKELYEIVKEDIPAHVGVYAEGKRSVKRASKQKLLVNERVLKDSLIRSLYRDTVKVRESENDMLINRLKRQIKKLERQKDKHEKMYDDLLQEIKKGGLR